MIITPDIRSKKSDLRYRNLLSNDTGFNVHKNNELINSISPAIIDIQMSVLRIRTQTVIAPPAVLSVRDLGRDLLGQDLDFLQSREDLEEDLENSRLGHSIKSVVAECQTRELCERSWSIAN